MMSYKMVDKMVLDSRAYKALKECGHYEHKLFAIETYTMTDTNVYHSIVHFDGRIVRAEVAKRSDVWRWNPCTGYSEYASI